MRSVGEVLKQKRITKKLTLPELSKRTRIKEEFIRAIEREDWKSLPEFPVVSGFVKSIAGSLSLDKKKASALLRRDYPPKKLEVNPKPDVKDKFVWSPKLTFVIGIAITILVVGVYLIFQYVNFVRPPQLEIYEPIDGVEVHEQNLKVSGKTTADSTVKVNNQPVIVEQDGKFEVDIEIVENTSEIVIIARSRSGKETEVVRKINPVFE